MTIGRVKHWWKATAVVITLLALAVLIVNYSASWYGEKKLNSILAKNQHYNIQYGSLYINVITGYCRLSKILIAPMNQSNSSLQIYATANSITVTGIGWYGLLFRKSISAHTLCLDHPVVRLKNFNHKKNVKNSFKTPNSVYDLIQPAYQSLKLGSLELNSGRITVSGIDSSNLFLDYSSINFRMNDITADSSLHADKKIFRIGSITASCKNIRGNFKKGLYGLHIPSVQIDSKASLITADSVWFGPTVDEKDFPVKLGYDKVCRTLMLSGISVQSAKMVQSIEEMKLLIDSAEIGYARIRNYRNKNFPRKPAHHVLPVTFLDSLPYKIDIGNLRVADGDIVYNSLAAGAPEPGHFDCDRLKITLNGFSTIHREDSMHVDVNARLMKKASFILHLTFPLHKNVFYATGTIGAFDLPIWNSMMKNYSPPILIVSGHSDSSYFHFVADEKVALGSMTFLYSDFHIHTLNKNFRSDGMKTRVRTFVANTLIMKDNNPDEGELRAGKIEFQRNPQKNLISYCKNAMTTGIESSVGLSKLKVKGK